jgi:hypothetical protein
MSTHGTHEDQRSTDEICQTTAECGYHDADYNRNVSINQILDYSIEAI